MAQRVAAIGYSKELHRIEIVVPHGTKTRELPAMMAILFEGGIIGRLPRPCLTCTSGDNLFVREQLEDVIEVDLDA
jgi:hypothetical protein